MVQAAKFQRKMRAMRTEVRDRLVDAVERQAEAVCIEMRAMLAIQYPGVAAQVEIDWTWGEDMPRGAITVGKTGRGRDAERIAVTIYATSKQGSGFSAAWFEFGTAPRFTKSGKGTGRIIAGPFFYPVYRANRQRIANNLRATLRRAIKKINAS